MTTRPEEYAMDCVHLQNALRGFINHFTDDKESLENTPARFVKALEEMTKGYHSSPEKILSKTFEVQCDEIVIVRAVAFTSLCEHHLLPFVGTCDIGYIPGHVVGLSKLARLVDCFASRLQMQERMTGQIADAIDGCLQAKAVGVISRASHSCMACRGVKKAGAEMVCSAMRGFFKESPVARAEFLQLCRD